MMEDDPRFDPPIRRYEGVRGVWGWVAAVAALLLIGFVILRAGITQHCKQRFLTAHHGQPHRDTAEHRGLRLVIAEADHPGAIEAPLTLHHSSEWVVVLRWRCKKHLRPPMPLRKNKRKVVRLCTSRLMISSVP